MVSPPTGVWPWWSQRRKIPPNNLKNSATETEKQDRHMELSDPPHIGILDMACNNLITILPITVDDIILSEKLRSDVYFLEDKLMRRPPGPVPSNYIHVP